jgi:hypothetical protein
MSQLDIYADVTTGKLTGSDGGTVALPAFVLGDIVRFQLHLLTPTDTGTTETDLFVRSMRASMGNTLQPPTDGQWDLRIPDAAHAGQYFTFGPLALDITPDALAPALTALFANVAVNVANVQSPAPGCWLFSVDAANPVDGFEGGTGNTLVPVSFVRTRAFQQGTKWWYEIRLIQAPLTFNVDGYTRELPPPPSVTEIRVGQPASDSGPAVNELQDLLLPADFKGTYFFHWNFRVSKIIGSTDGPDVVADALNSMFGDGAKRFAVTVPEAEHGYIEFIGDLAGQPQPLITVEVHDHPPGVLTFVLPLDRAEMATALRTATSITVPLEIEVEIVDNEDDLDNVSIPGRFLTLCQQSVTIVREQIWKEMASVQQIDFQRPTSPKTYLPYNQSQLIPGQQHYPFVCGDGESTAIDIDHNLHTRNLAGPPMVALNGGTWKILTHNLDYEVRITSEDFITLVFAVAPPVNGIFGVITTAGPVSTFIADLLIAIANVNGLQALLDTLSGRISVLEGLVPTGTLVLPATSTPSDSFDVPDRFFVYPNSRLADGFDASTLVGVSGAKAVAALPRPPGLLPAIQDAAPTTFSSASLPASPSAGHVYQNTGSNPVLVPGGLGRRGRFLAVNDYAGFDGRVWFAVSRGSSTSKTWFPEDFEEIVSDPFTFEPDTWRAGQVFAFEFDAMVAVLRANTNAQWVLIVEHGTTKSETDASGTAIDITSAGTGTQTVYYDSEAIGNFTVDPATDTFTLAAHGFDDGDIVQVGNAGGAFPAGLAANTDYVVRDSAANTFKLTVITTTMSLRDVVWNSTPILTQRLTVSQLQQKRHFGVRVIRSAQNAITTQQLKARAWSVGDSAPRTPRFALRGRLRNFDTQNPVTDATGYALAAFTGATATLT